MILVIAFVALVLIPLFALVGYMHWVRPYQWRGQMLCRSCGHRWRTRQSAPAKQCGKCWHDDVVPVSEAEPGGITKGRVASD